MSIDNPHIGSALDNFLEAEGIKEDVHAVALKRTIAMQIEQARTDQNISKSEMARRMKTSATQLSRLLDPDNDHVRLDTLMKAASAVGRSLEIKLV
jgi:predicted XRE-type DNA-binding protein